MSDSLADRVKLYADMLPARSIISAAQKELYTLAEEVRALKSENAELKQAIQNTLDTGMDRYIKEVVDHE